MKIRNYQERDLKDLPALYSQIGYPVNQEELEERLEKILSDQNYQLIVAEIDGKVVGFAGICTMYMFEKSVEYIRILALVVDSDFRKQGIAGKILDYIKEWGRSEGLFAMTLNSGINSDRENAHNFYENYGFHRGSYGFKLEINSHLKID